MIKTRIAKSVMVGIAASAAIGLTATAFAAVPFYKITAGTHTTGTPSYTAKTAGTSANPAIKFNDTSTGLGTTCDNATASGTIKLGAHISGTAAGNIAKTTWSNCKATGGFKLFPKQPTTSKWTLNGAAPTASGITKVFIGNVTANVTTNFGCSFTVKGSADGTYNNATGKLALKPRAGSGHVLKAANVQSCLQQVNNGDKLAFIGTYAVSTVDGKLKIVNA